MAINTLLYFFQISQVKEKTLQDKDTQLFHHYKIHKLRLV